MKMQMGEQMKGSNENTLPPQRTNQYRIDSEAVKIVRNQITSDWEGSVCSTSAFADTAFWQTYVYKAAFRLQPYYRQCVLRFNLDLSEVTT